MATSATLVANFLAEAAGPLPHEGGLKGETVRVLASGLKMVLQSKGVDLESLPDYDILERVLQGLRNRPDRQRPREERWDTSRLLDYWHGLPDNSDLSQEQLRAKAITLLMLVGLARPSDLERLDADTLVVSSDGISIRSFMAKNSGNSYDEPISIPFLQSAKRKVCAARALRAYIAETEDLRSECPDSAVGVRPVFIHLGKPRPLSAQRISKVMKGVLTELGIPHRSYSTRGNAATSAIEQGIDPVVVQKAGRWRSASTMTKFYVKGLSTSPVTHVLSSSSTRARRRPTAR